MSFAEFAKRTLFVVLLALIMVCVWLLRDQLLLATLAIVLAVGMGVFVRWFQRKWKVKHGLAVLLAVVLTLGIATLLGFIMIPPIINELGSLVRELPGLVNNAVDGYEQLRLATSEYLVNVLPPLRNIETGALEVSPDLVESLLDYFGSTVSAGLPILYGGLTAISGIIGNLLIILVIAIMLLIEPGTYVRVSLYLVPERKRQRLLDVWNAVYMTLVTWIRAQLASVFITTALVWLVLGGILGASHAITVAVIAGLSSFIPNIGAFLPLIPILLFQLAADPAKLLVVAPVYLIIQLLESNVITPSIVKSELNIPVAAVLVFQLVAAILFGAIGIVLAVPILAVGIVLVRELYSFDTLGLKDKPVAVGLDETGFLTMVDPSELEGTAARQVNHESLSSKSRRFFAKLRDWFKNLLGRRFKPPVDKDKEE